MNTTGVDLLNLVQRYTSLKKVAGTGGGEWHGPCPLCSGVDRFQVQPNYTYPRWACRQCSPTWQDAIEFVKWAEGVDFKTACERLELGDSTMQKMHNAPTPRNNRVVQPAPPKIITLSDRYPALTDRDWQRRAGDFALDCNERLFSDVGKAAMDYLLGRGLTRQIIGVTGLGFNDQERRTEWGETEVWLPRSITIPWQYQGQYWRVNMRRPDGEPKYISPKGSANGLYGVQHIKPGCTVVMVEGEFDALAIRSQAPELVKIGFVPVATGTASWGRVLRWVAAVGMAKRVLLAFDADDAGDGAATWWQGKLGAKAIRLRPTAHDVTDMIPAGADIERWLLEGFCSHLERVA